MQLNYEQGTISLKDVEKNSLDIPFVKWDDRTGYYRAEGYKYHNIIQYLKDKDIEYEDNVLDLLEKPNLKTTEDFSLREYQKKAYESWAEENNNGVIVIPTAGGKTFIGISAIEKVNTPTLVLVPKLDLIGEWKSKFEKCFKDTEDVIGKYYGSEKDLKPVTISTYDSAYINIENIGNKFNMVIADEAHHLAAESYIHIAKFSPSYNRLGLTATLSRPDGRHKELYDVFGKKVYDVDKDKLTEEGYLADCEVNKIKVSLNQNERKKYDKKMKKFKEYLAKHDYDIGYKEIVMESGSDKEAWEAIRAHEEGKRIAFNSQAKIDKLKELLKKFREEEKENKIIIFCRYNDLVKRISDKFFIPMITHKTEEDEREEIFRKFKEGEYNSLVSAQILEEGADIPSANVGIILAGTGSSRELIQRMGRILRPKGGVARLYEVVSSETSELNVRSRRWKNH